MLRMITSALAVAAALAASSLVAARDAPAHPGVDAPELAPLGGHAVGTTELDWRWKDQLDPLQAKDAPVPFERHLRVRVWYPAGVASAAGQGITYHSSLPGPDTVEVPFDIPGLALSDAKPEPGHFPLVILAHGYSNTPEALAPARAMSSPPRPSPIRRSASARNLSALWLAARLTLPWSWCAPRP